MSQDQFPPLPAPDQEPRTSSEESSDTISEAQQPEVPSDLASELLPAALEHFSLEESGVGQEEPSGEPSPEISGEFDLGESAGEPSPEISGEFDLGKSEVSSQPVEVEPPLAPVGQSISRESDAADRQSVVSSQSISQTAQDVWTKVRPVLQTQTVKVLKGTIQLLEGIVEKLENRKTEKSGAPGSGTRSENMPPTSETVPDKLVPPFLTDELPEKFRSAWQRLQQWWRTVLPQIRERLPESLNEKFSDRAITGATIAILILFLWIVPGLFSGKPKPTPIAKAPPVQKVTPPVAKPSGPPRNGIPELTKPMPSTPTEQKPVPKPVVQSTPASSPQPAPPPSLKLTPEQTLIARIQDQVAAISNQYLNGLIQSVQANFRTSRLIVKIGDGWYGLSQAQQNKLANEVLQRTQELDFSKLEITDTEGTLLARSPVVGSEMIILKRDREGV
ncbi:MAG: hypothetical protein WCA35_12450 [Kovacikia sp.]